MRIYKRKEVVHTKDFMQKIVCDVCGTEYKSEHDFKYLRKTFDLNDDEIPGVCEISTDKAEGYCGVLFHDRRYDDLETVMLDVCGNCCVDFLMKIIRKYKKQNQYVKEENDI